MSCTPDEIAEKKRIALERLLKNKQQKPIETIPNSSLVSLLNNSYNQLPGTTNELKSCSTNQIKNQRMSPYGKSREQIEKPKKLASVFVKTISCTCSLITEKRFVVINSGFHAKLIDVFKTIPTKSYNITTQHWSFDLKDYQLVQDRVSALNPDVTIGQLPNFIIKLFDNVKKPQNPIDCLSCLEPIILNSLKPFQRDGVLFGIEKKGRCLIADEMGLGKTYQALALADFYKDDWPLIICTTASTRNSWTTKIYELLPNIRRDKIVTITSIQDFNNLDAQIIIISYNLMERNCERILERNCRFIILDESHLLKNNKAKSTITALQLANRARRIILLTGTPALSRPSELFSQLQMIDPKFFTFKEYSLRYCDGKQGQFGWDSSGQSNLTELNILLNKKFMIRRTKQEVLTDLADKSRETIMLDKSLIWTDDETSENMKTYAQDFSQLNGRAREELLLKYYAETARAKTKAVCSYIKNLIKDKKKFLIFAHHQVMLNAISKFLTKLTVDFIRIDGSTKNDLRNLFVERFQNETQCQVAVLSLKACNAGITLTAAQLILFAELDWNPSTLAQAEGRAHRIGQEGVVKCQYLLGQGTADDIIWDILKKKQETLNKAGLFNDNLSDGRFMSVATTTTTTSESSHQENIERFVVRTPKKLNNENNQNIDQTTNKELSSFLDDGDDEDFLNINF